LRGFKGSRGQGERIKVKNRIQAFEGSRGQGEKIKKLTAVSSQLKGDKQTAFSNQQKIKKKIRHRERRVGLILIFKFLSNSKFKIRNSKLFCKPAASLQNNFNVGMCLEVQIYRIALFFTLNCDFQVQAKVFP
jgi:hypothetical protein